MNGLAATIFADRLIWAPEIGIGYFPVQAGSEVYDEEYFERIKKNADSDIGRALMRARCDLVEKYHRGVVLDVGIGSGAFIELRNARGFPTLGFDVNPVAVEYLKRRGLFADPYAEKQEAICCWDVLEHLEDPRILISQVKDWLFLSLPIFSGPMHALASKHFRKTEHFWYWTRAGLIRMMGELGFRIVEYTDVETKIGREDIESFAFRRI